MLNEDYRDMLRILLENDVRFLIVGAYALAAYGYPRATGDLDLWVEPSLTNSRKILESLIAFGTPAKDLSEETFTEKGIVLQIGVAPRRIDMITAIDGVDFQEAYGEKKIFEIDNLRIPFLSKNDLIKNKRSTGREKDKLDAEYLSKTPDA